MSAKTLVLVHGFLGSSLNWGPILSRLQKESSLSSRWNFRTVDLLWHGRRKGPEEPALCTLSTMVKDFEEQVSDLDTFYGLGHSFGLRPLLKLSSTRPDKLLAIIAEDSSPEISQKGFEELNNIFQKVPIPFKTREEAKIFLDNFFTSDPVLARFLLSNIREIQEGEHRWRFQDKALKWILNDSKLNPLWKEWSSFQGPITIIKGDNEKSFLKPEILEKCLRSRAGLVTDVIEIAQSGHWVHSEQPETFVKSLVKVLNNFE